MSLPRGRFFPQSPPRWLQISDVIFTSLFVLEMGMKLVALGFHYFVDVWNWLDAIVVVEVRSLGAHSIQNITDYSEDTSALETRLIVRREAIRVGLG